MADGPFQTDDLPLTGDDLMGRPSPLEAMRNAPLRRASTDAGMSTVPPNVLGSYEGRMPEYRDNSYFTKEGQPVTHNKRPDYYSPGAGRFADRNLEPLAGLASSVPEGSPWGRAEYQLAKAISPITTHTQWALRYPERVIKRALGVPLSGPFQPSDDFSELMGGVTQAGFDRMGQKYDPSMSTYTPGPRESTNVDDRRPTSIFSYW